MLTIKHYHSLEDAEVGRSVLEGHGIHAFVPNSSTQSNLPFLNMLRTGVCLEVAEEDAEEACQLLGIKEVPPPTRYSVNWMIAFFFLVGALIGFAIWSANR